MRSRWRPRKRSWPTRQWRREMERLEKAHMRPAGCDCKFGPKASSSTVAISSNHNVRNHRKARRETRAGMENKKASFRLPTRPHQKNWSERTSSENEYPKKKELTKSRKSYHAVYGPQPLRFPSRSSPVSRISREAGDPPSEAVQLARRAAAQSSQPAARRRG